MTIIIHTHTHVRKYLLSSGVNGVLVTNRIHLANQKGLLIVTREIVKASEARLLARPQIVEIKNAQCGATAIAYDMVKNGVNYKLMQNKPCVCKDVKT